MFASVNQKANNLLISSLPTYFILSRGIYIYHAYTHAIVYVKSSSLDAASQIPNRCIVAITVALNSCDTDRYRQADDLVISQPDKFALKPNIKL